MAQQGSTEGARLLTLVLSSADGYRVELDREFGSKVDSNTLVVESDSQQ